LLNKEANRNINLNIIDGKVNPSRILKNKEIKERKTNKSINPEIERTKSTNRNGISQDFLPKFTEVNSDISISSLSSVSSKLRKEFIENIPKNYLSNEKRHIRKVNNKQH